MTHIQSRIDHEEIILNVMSIYIHIDLIYFTRKFTMNF